MPATHSRRHLRARHPAAARRWRIPVEPVSCPAAMVEVTGGVVVTGIAAVEAGPHRPLREAFELAARIACRPGTYLPLCIGLGLPGVTDLRPAAPKLA